MSARVMAPISRSRFEQGGAVVLKELSHGRGAAVFGRVDGLGEGIGSGVDDEQVAGRARALGSVRKLSVQAREFGLIV